MLNIISRWMFMWLCLKAQCCATCCHGSGYLWPRLRAHSCCQVERGDGESRRPLAELAIGSEKRRNVGQLCHPFEVRTACLWSGGWALGFHVLLSCDLGRPQLHKPYWLYCPKKKKKKTLTQSIPAFMGLGSLKLYEVRWMKERWEFQGQPMTHLRNRQILKCSWVLTHYLRNSKRFKEMMWQLISSCIIVPTMWHLFTILLTILSHSISIRSVIL